MVRVSTRYQKKLAPGQSDVWMGAGLIWAFALIVLSTTWALRSSQDSVRAIFAVVLGAVAADFVLVLLPWKRLPTQVLIVFPLLILGMELSLAATTTGVASDYTGFFTLAFIFIGLTQPRGTSVVFAVLVAPTWVYCQDGFTSQVGVRLPIALGIWILIGEVLAARAARSSELAQELCERASTDALTGLPSRQTLIERIDGRLSSSEAGTSSLLLVNIDGFKAINDAFGHPVGDELLVEVANRLRASIEDGDMIARLGGDEFAVYLDHRSPSEAIVFGAHLMSSIATPIELTRGSAGVTASVGVLDLRECKTSGLALRNVDVALFEAKSTGRNRLSVFEEQMQKRIEDRLQLESELRRAVDEEQFEVYYQPTVNLETHQIVGYEALVRWNHPTRGLLAPGAFIDVCENSGLISRLGSFVLTTACNQAREWQPSDPGRRLTMAVNLSALQLFNSDLVAEVATALSVSGLRGDALVLEITERLLLADSPFVMRQLNGLKQLGIRIAIDDFGTGYSSLAYLREFPVDILKIDRSFVMPMNESRRAYALVKSIVSLAEALELDVIGEGAETASQVDTLARLGCTVIQGYYFGRPSSADEVSRYLAAHGTAGRARAAGDAS
jgi:diguanylate cyclase (GGDEF)-like protein